MTLPYSSSTSGKNALTEIQKILRAFDCTKFATGEDFEAGEVFVQFEHKGRMVMLKVSAKGYAAAWLRENPWSYRRRGSESEYKAKALEIGSTAIYSVLRDYIKGQVTYVEIGMMTFEEAFLSHLMLPDGQRVIEKFHKMKLLEAKDG